MKNSKKIKEILIKLAGDDKLPLDMTTLDESIFNEFNRGETYYLFTEKDTIDLYKTTGLIDSIEKDIKELDVRYNLYCHNENNPSLELGYQFYEWNDYVILNKEEYDQLSDI